MTTTAPAPLTTGWEAGTDDGDSLCRRYLYHWVEQCELVVGAAGGTVRRRPGYALADAPRTTGMFDGVTLLAPPEDIHGLLDEIEPVLDQTGTAGHVHLWSLWPTPDLSARGWQLEGHPPLLLRPPARVAPVEPPAAPPREVRTLEELRAWERAVVDGFPLSGGALASPGLLDDDRIRLFLTEDAGRPATGSALFVARGLASLAMAATIPAARRQGHWLDHARHRLRLEPDRWFAGVFSDFSRPGAEALGFVPIVRFTLWRRSRTRTGDQA